MTARTWTWPATVLRWRDADTAVCVLDLGIRIAATVPVRIADIDAPERGTPEGQAARDWATQHVPPGSVVVVTSHSLDRYGRILGTVTLADGSDYATALQTAGHARPYQ